MYLIIHVTKILLAVVPSSGKIKANLLPIWSAYAPIMSPEIIPGHAAE